MNTIELKHPIVMDEQTLTRLTMREPKVKDQLQTEKIPTIGLREATLFARLCDVELRVIEELPLADYQKLQEVYSGFLA